MSKRPIEGITSVEERLVAACFEPGAVISEIARAAGIHVSQLFRWRKELCRIVEPAKEAINTLVPVIVPDVGLPVPLAATEPPATSPTRRKRSDVTIELGWAEVSAWIATSTRKR